MTLISHIVRRVLIEIAILGCIVSIDINIYNIARESGAIYRLIGILSHLCLVWVKLDSE